MTKRNAATTRTMTDLLETAADLNTFGLMNKNDLARLYLLCNEPPLFTAEQVVNIRTNIAKASQSVFASALNVHVKTLQRWESVKAAQRPSGPSAKLLQLIEKKGLQAVLI